MAFFNFGSFGGFNPQSFFSFTPTYSFEQFVPQPPAPAPEPEPAPENIIDIAAGSDDFNILTKAIEVTGLTDTVRGLDDVTVFAPTDVAFTQLALDLGYEGDASDEDAVFTYLAGQLTELSPDGDPIPLLTDILLYHVSPGAKTAAEIDADDDIATLLADATFATEGSELIDNEPDVANPNIIIEDIDAENGTIQAIDRVLLPIDIPGNDLPNIVDIAAGSDDFTILTAALDATGLTETVQNADDITVFAPTDAAFGQLATDLGFEGDLEDDDAVFGFIAGELTALSPDGDPIPLLTDILLYHVSGGSKSLDDLNEEGNVSTLLDGATIHVDGNELGDAEPDIENPDVITADVAASNGTVQVIDRVLIPADIPGNEAEDTPTEGFDFTSFIPTFEGSDAFNELAELTQKLQDLQDFEFPIPLRAAQDFGNDQARHDEDETQADDFWV